MIERSARAIAVVALVMIAPDPAAAHHVMGGRTPTTLLHGLLSGLGHPIIGLDHLAAIIAVGCLAAALRIGPALIVAYVLAQLAGAAFHGAGANLPGAEILVAASVLVLGAVAVRRTAIGPAFAVILFVTAGLVHGYALAESIIGAERTPLIAYFAGLFVVQCAIGIAAMTAARWLAAGHDGQPEPVRLAGAAIAGIGLAIAAQQLIPGA